VDLGAAHDSSFYKPACPLPLQPGPAAARPVPDLLQIYWGHMTNSPQTRRRLAALSTSPGGGQPCLAPRWGSAQRCRTRKSVRTKTFRM
jgi:hypothetical protein